MNLIFTTRDHECPTCGADCLACTPENDHLVSHSCSDEECGDEWFTEPCWSCRGDGYVAGLGGHEVRCFEYKGHGTVMAEVSTERQ